MSNFSYELSYFREKKPSSIDIKFKTNGQEAHGLQLIAEVEAEPKIEIIDQKPDRAGIQIGVNDQPQLNFLTNKVEPIANGYKIVLGAITSNPKEPFKTEVNDVDGIVAAKLIFTQEKSGYVTLKTDQQATKIATVESEGVRAESNLNPEKKTEEAMGAEKVVSKEVVELATQDTGDSLSLLYGQTYVAPKIEVDGASGVDHSTGRSNENEAALSKTQAKEAQATTKLKNSWLQQRFSIQLLLGGVVVISLFSVAITLWLVRLRKKRRQKEQRQRERGQRENRDREQRQRTETEQRQREQQQQLKQRQQLQQQQPSGPHAHTQHKPSAP